jgi:hypothetical protein
MDSPIPAAKIKKEPGSFQPRTYENQSNPVVSSKSVVGLTTRHPNGPVPVAGAKKRNRKLVESTDKRPSKKSRGSTKPIIQRGCDGCKKIPCNHMSNLLSLHKELQASHYHFVTYEGIKGNNKRRKHFYAEWTKQHGKLNECVCIYARSIFPRIE